MKLTEIVPRLYTRGRLSVRRSAAELRGDLHDAGIDVVVSLTRQGEPALEGQDHIRYLHAPMSDGGTVDTAVVTWLACELSQELRAGKRVLVMCRAGRNRTGLVVATTLTIYLGISGAEALDLLRERRPRAVDNAAFERWLRSR